MENYLLMESASHQVNSQVEMESILSALLHPCCKLRELTLDLSPGDKAKVEMESIVSTLLHPSCKLRELELDIKFFSGDYFLDTAEKLAAGMIVTAIESEKCSLHSLNLIKWRDNQGVRSLAKALQSPNCHLESLGLKNSWIGSEGAKNLSEALQSPNCHLKTLDLQVNNIGSEGAKSLSEALQSPNCHLKTLGLQYNQIASDGIKSLVKALESENCHLISLDLWDNSVGMSDVEALAEFLESKSCRFEFLDLRRNEDEQQLLDSKWFNATSQAELLLRQNKLRFTIPGPKYSEKYISWRTLVNALASKDCHVQALDIRGHSLEDDNLSLLFQSLTSGSCQLKSLMLGLIADLREIAKALQSPHCQLEHLTVVDFVADFVAGSKGDPIFLGDALQSYQCKLQTFSFMNSYYGSGSGRYDHFIARIADALKQQHCKLENLVLAIQHTEDDEKQLLHALKFNSLCPLQQLHIDCTSPLIEKQFTDILNRNRILRQSEIADYPQVQPTTAKLFICGFSGVGKTTLRKNLLRKMARPKRLQQHPSTTGMDLRTLQFGEKKLVLCDLAGQKEFHAFHHHFVRGSDKDIFLIVCKAPSREDNSCVVQFNNELGYWLRFIVSHSWLSSKPKVLIVLNYFSPFFEDKTTDARGLTRNQIDKYNGFLDFGKSYIEDNVFGVVALNPKDLRLLKAKIEVTLGDLLQQRPKIPLLCRQLLERNLPSFIRCPMVCARGDWEFHNA